MKKFWGVLVLLFFSFAGPLFSQENQEVTTIKILNARETSYQKNEESEDDIIVLEGNVELSVSKGENVSEVKADYVTFDRKTQMLYASGNVEIVTKSNSSGGETTKASSLMMNTSTMEGVFDQGNVVQTQSDAINLPSGSTLIVFSDLFGKTQNNTIVFKNSTLTFCDDPNPHWHIDATRTWLLPGGEFAFFNAVLFVGPVPVMYFPAFYYPKDELIFNPVFGYRNREGTYIQTTTYLKGRKPLNSQESLIGSNDSFSQSIDGLYNFMKSNTLKDQKREGIVLHNLDTDFTGDSSKYIKFMADAYTNLGFLLGVNGNIIPEKFSFISNMNYDLSLAFSTTVFGVSNKYLPISSTGDKYWDKSNFLGLKLPFRYKLLFDVSINVPFPIEISLPLYSDPYFQYDFERRDESMNWISYLMSSKDNKAPEFIETSSLVWKINTSNSFAIPDSLKPYINFASFSLNSSVNLSSATNTIINDDDRTQKGDGWKYYTPERKFYYPSTITPVNTSFTISGTLLKYPQVSVSEKTEQYEIPLEKPELLKDKDENKSSENQNQIKESNEQDSQTENQEDYVMTFPLLNRKNVNPLNMQLLNYSLSYSINPSFLHQLTYDSSNFANQDDFSWKKIKSSMYSIKIPVNLSSNLNFGNDFFVMNNNFQYIPLWQKHPNLDGYNETDKKSIISADYNAETQTILNTNVLTFKPLKNISGFSNTSISWNTSFKLLNKIFTGDADNPKWEYYGLDFSDDQSVTENLLNILFYSSQMENKFSQSLSLSSTLSPQVPKFSGQLNLIFPHVAFNLSSSIQQVSKEDKTWVKNPLVESLDFSFFDSSLLISQSISFNLEETRMENFRFSVSYKNFSAIYVMSNTFDYDFDETGMTGWISKDQKSFIPYSFSLNYEYNPDVFYKWNNRISIAPTLQTSIVADLVRPTNSYFLFTPGITFKINDFLDITFSATSKNSVLYRYFQNLLGHPGRIPGEENIFIDLLDSFRFDNILLRKNSGFKLKSLNLIINHDLHDWKFNMGLKFEPRLVNKNGSQYYDYNPYFTIGVSWNPMESMKTKITDEYGVLKFE